MYNQTFHVELYKTKKLYPYMIIIDNYIINENYNYDNVKDS